MAIEPLASVMSIQVQGAANIKPSAQESRQAEHEGVRTVQEPVKVDITTNVVEQSKNKEYAGNNENGEKLSSRKNGERQAAPAKQNGTAQAARQNGTAQAAPANLNGEKQAAPVKLSVTKQAAPIKQDAKDQAVRQEANRQSMKETADKNEQIIHKAIEHLNKNMPHSEAIFGIHEETNRVIIKIIDKETKELIKELPPEKTLDLIAKAWELAGMLVDERR